MRPPLRHKARYSFTDIKAHEWEDQPETLRTKVRELAGMVRPSRFCLDRTTTACRRKPAIRRPR